jgi:hypothetical protein
MMSRVYHSTCCSKWHMIRLLLLFFLSSLAHYGMNQNLKLDEVYSRLFYFLKWNKLYWLFWTEQNNIIDGFVFNMGKCGLQVDSHEPKSWPTSCKINLMRMRPGKRYKKRTFYYRNKKRAVWRRLFKSYWRHVYVFN